VEYILRCAQVIERSSVVQNAIVNVNGAQICSARSRFNNVEKVADPQALIDINLMEFLAVLNGVRHTQNSRRSSISRSRQPENVTRVEPLIKHVAVVEDNSIKENGTKIIPLLLRLHKIQEVANSLIPRKHDQPRPFIVIKAVGHAELRQPISVLDWQSTDQIVTAKMTGKMERIGRYVVKIKKIWDWLKRRWISVTETEDYEQIALTGQISTEFSSSEWQMSCPTKLFTHNDLTCHRRLCSQIWFQSRFRSKCKCDKYPLLEC
jgi:hypothetical protein